MEGWKINLILLNESSTCLRGQMVFDLDHGNELQLARQSQGDAFQTWGMVCTELQMQKGPAYVEDDF